MEVWPESHALVTYEDGTKVVASHEPRRWSDMDPPWAKFCGGGRQSGKSKQSLDDVLQLVMSQPFSFDDRLHRRGQTFRIFGAPFEVVRSLRVQNGEAFLRAVRDGRLKPLF